MSGAHHELGMSRWSAWAVCPCFTSGAETDDAKVGAALHEKLHAVLTGKDMVALDETDAGDRAVKWAAEEICKGIPESAALHSEDRVEIPKSMSETLGGIFGTADAWFADDGANRLHVFDFKSMSRDNGEDLYPQLMGYAIGIAATFPERGKGMTVALHILHGGVFRHTFIETDIAECVRQSEAVVARHLMADGDADAEMPSRWCRYCGRCAECRTMNGELGMASSAVTLAKLSAPRRLDLIERLEAMLKKAKDEAKAEIEAAEGKRMEDGGIAYAIREVAAPAKMIPGMILPLYSRLTEIGVPHDAFMDRCRIGKGDVVKLLQGAGLKVRSKDPNAVTAESVASEYFESGRTTRLERCK